MRDAFQTHKEKRISEMSERVRNSRIKKKEKVVIFHNMSNKRGKISTE
jgi:hypothetical protein